MKKQFELLAPGGDLESIKAAIVAGADAIYCGLNHFNARNRAANMDFDDLNNVVRLAHQHDCEIFLTLNIIILESEVSSLVRLINRLVNTNIDGVIVQDLGLAYILKHHFPSLDVHASTQLNTHNEGQILFLNQLTASRVNLSRELNIKEISHLAKFGRQYDVLMEVFVHGSYCIGFSGLCYISSLRNGSSGNRGRCSQPCRDQYQTTEAGNDFPLNMKDNSAFFDMKALADAGVYSLKVEGRIKKSHYVYTVVDNWRQQIDRYCEGRALIKDNTELYTVFNRDFSNSYLMGDINKAMFIDNPRDNSAAHFAKQDNATTDEEFKQVKRRLYDKKTDIITHVAEEIAPLSYDKWPIQVSLVGSEGESLAITVTTPTRQFSVSSEAVLEKSEKYGLDQAKVQKWLVGLNNIDHQVDSFDLSKLTEGVTIPFKQQSALRDALLTELNFGKATVGEVQLPMLDASNQIAATDATPPKLSVLVADVESYQEVVDAAGDQDIDVYFQMPEAIHAGLERLVEVFIARPQLIPFFPAILIGDNYQAACDFLAKVKPRRIVTNNSGVAYSACQQGIDWLAGPQMNVTNSYTLKCLKEEFNCVGAFLSNEVNKNQLRKIVCPEDFELHYSMFHPNMLLTSRQCLFHQTVGCKRKRFDARCLTGCDKTASILSLKDSSFILDKQLGSHNALYAEQHVLNTDIISDLPGRIDCGMIDLREIKTHTNTVKDKAEIIRSFSQALAGKPDAVQSLFGSTCNKQYRKGL